MRGFFSPSEMISKQPASTLPKCGACGLYKHCISPKMPPTGKGKKKIFVLAEGPGENEDRENTQLIGKAGQFTRKIFGEFGVNLNRDCLKYNSINCRRKNNETPTDDMISYCRPNVLKAIAEFKPNVIILLGAVACKSLLKNIWKEDIGGVSRWGDTCIPCQKPNAWIVPTYHPSYLLRMHDDILDDIFRRHLRRGFKKKKRPWKTLPNYEDQVELIVRPYKAAKAIREIIKLGGIAAFDYEANCLKPELPKAEILSCSICLEGKTTIAFPWSGEVIEAMYEFVKSKRIQKIASNLKFEQRWTKIHLGCNVRSWYWDTMIAAHIIDNKPDITGLKFQSFVLLGAEDYDSHIKPYMKNDKDGYNKLKQLDLKDLLTYNGLDSELEYLVAMKQIKILRRRYEVQRNS